MKSSELEEKTLREPVDRGVRLVALSLIDDARHAAEILANLSDQLRAGDVEADEALHDFRVEIRRLRSWMRGFRPWLTGDVSRKRRRRLSRIADATRESRDATVHLQWLQTERAAPGARQHEGVTWIVDEIEKRRSKGSVDAVAAGSDFETMAPKLSRRLKFYRAAVCDEDVDERFGAVYSQRILKQSKELRDCLAEVRGFSDVRRAHRARIAAKNLRYLIEPVAKLVDGGEAIVETLKGMQDLLGDLHDVHVFGEELAAASEKSSGLPRPGLLGLARRLQERGTHAFEQVEGRWLNDSGAELFEMVRDFAERLSAASIAPETELPRAATSLASVVA